MLGFFFQLARSIITSRLINKQHEGLGISASEDVQGERMSKVLISPETTRPLQELVMKPQMGWEVARAAAWQDYGAEGWSHLKAKRGQETKGWDLELLPILTLSPWPLPSLLCVWRHSLFPCSFLCPVGIWDYWDLHRNPFRRQVRSTLLELLLPEIFGLNSLIRV